MSIQYKVNLNFTSTEYNCPDMKAGSIEPVLM